MGFLARSLGPEFPLAAADTGGVGAYAHRVFSGVVVSSPTGMESIAFHRCCKAFAHQDFHMDPIARHRAGRG